MIKKCQSKRPKILHFTHSFFPVFGGTSTRNYNLMRDERFEHHVYVPQAPSNYIPEKLGRLKGHELLGNIKITRVILPDKTEKITLFKKLPYYIQFIIDVRSRAKALYGAATGKHYDIVYGHSPLEFGVAAYYYAKKNRLPLIYEAHSFLTDSLSESLLSNIDVKNCLVRIYRRCLFNFVNHYETAIINHASNIIAQTNKIKMKLMGTFSVPEKKILTVINGVDCNFFKPTGNDKTNKFRKQCDLADEFIVLYSGFLNSINGIDFLLSAFAQLPHKLKEKTKLVIAGRGPLQSHVEEAAKKDTAIIYIGLVKYDDMPELYELCNVFVIPRPSVKAAEEFYPMKLIEVMSMGKPVLVSDVAPMAEIINDGVTGLYYKKGDMENFLAKLTSIYNREYDLSKMGDSARKLVTNHYSWEKAGSILRGKYFELMK